MACWGNRLALRIPRDLAAKSRLTAGVGGEPATKSDDFVVRRSAPNYDLSVLLAGVRPGNRPEEIATRPALGKEVWWYQRPLVSRL